MSIANLRGEPELVDLKNRAETLATERRERLTTAHLLVAFMDTQSPVAELLRERRLTREALLKAARSASDDEPDPVRLAVQRAREIASRQRALEPTGLHLLVALLSTRQGAAYRALDQSGVDVNRLRTAALNAGLSAVGRTGAQAVQKPQLVPTSVPVGSPRTRAVSVPLMQPVQRGASAKGPQQSATDASNASVASPGHAEDRADPTPPPRRRARKKAQRPRQQLDPKRFRLLSQLGRDLVALAARGELEPVAERDQEVELLLDVLAKQQGNSPCLVGPSGIGKTAIVHALAQRLAHAPMPSDARDGRAVDELVLIEVSVTSLLKGALQRGALTQRFAELKQEVEQARPGIVLVFDEFQQLFGPESNEELIGELKRALAQKHLRCVATLRPEDYQRHVESDAALSRCLTRLDVAELDAEAAVRVLRSVAPRLAEHHGLPFDAGALEAGVEWSARYVAGQVLPQKAISTLDLAAARARRRGLASVGKESVAEVLSSWTEVPVERLLETDGQRMLRLEESLAQCVVGHKAALGRIASLLRRNAAGLGGQRPIGTLLLLGPTGVGKTETAKAIAQALFGSTQALTRLDLSEYSEAHAVARLIGSPPGYVGYEAGGQLTEAVRKRPYQVLLLDEIEKAHQEVLETFLPVFDEGRLTDGRGQTVDFRNTVIVLTSNIGAREAVGTAKRRVGFGHSGAVQDAQNDRVIAAARERLSPEFYNRLDEVLVFGPLESREVEEIAKRALAKLAQTVHAQRGILLEFASDVTQLLLRQGGFDAALGARPMRRAVARWIEAPLAEALLSERFQRADRVVVSTDGQRVVFARGARVCAAE